jgi:hypothetical protein
MLIAILLLALPRIAAAQPGNAMTACLGRDETLYAPLCSS